MNGKMTFMPIDYGDIEPKWMTTKERQHHEFLKGLEARRVESGWIDGNTPPTPTP